jgi:hypothetical protein
LLVHIDGDVHKQVTHIQCLSRTLDRNVQVRTYERIARASHKTHGDTKTPSGKVRLWLRLPGGGEVD